MKVSHTKTKTFVTADAKLPKIITRKEAKGRKTKVSMQATNEKNGGKRHTRKKKKMKASQLSMK